MKTAVIAPIPLLQKYPGADGYHLCLCKHVLESDDYAYFYEVRSANGDFVILDNMAHESSEGVEVGTLIKAHKKIQASEIVLPDRLFFGEDTLDRSRQAFEQLIDAEETQDCQFMGVPQGRTQREWVDCLRGLLDLGLDTIGISKDYEVWPGGLVNLVELVHLASNTTNIHLLGWGREASQLKTIATSGIPVRGVDSAKPLAYASLGIDLTREVPKYPGRPRDFFNLTELDHTLASRNLDYFRVQAGSLSRMPEQHPV